MEDTKTAVTEDEGKQPVALPTTEKPAEVSAPPTEETRPVESEGQKTQEEGKLPDEVKERTREEFEKLKAKNKELAEKLNQYERPQPKRSALDMFAPNQVPGQVPQPIQFQPQFGPQTKVEPQVEEIKPIVPDENGYIDVNALNSTIKAINERNRRVEEEARKAREEARRTEERVSKFEHTDKTLKTYEKFPYLDPNRPEFDEKFSDLVRKELLDQMVNQGREDYLAAAERVKKDYYDPTFKPQPKADLEAKENIAKRDQAAALPGAGRGENKPIDQEYLEMESRRGNRDAVYQRLKQSGY